MKKLLILSCLITIKILCGQNLIVDGGFNDWNGTYLTKWHSHNCVYERNGNASNYNVKLKIGDWPYPLPQYKGIIYQPFQYVPITNGGVTTRYHKLKFKYRFSGNSALALDVKIQTYTAPNIFVECDKNFATQDEKIFKFTPDATNTNAWKTFEVIIDGAVSNTEKRLLEFEAYKTVAYLNSTHYVLIDDVSIEAVPNLAIGDISKPKFQIFPNPVRNTLQIQTDNKILSGKIYNIYGQLLSEFSVNKINVEHLSKGIYIVEIKTDDNKILKQKIIKN